MGARRKALRVGAWGVLLGTAVVYGLALNPYPLPATYDNLLYYSAGRALAETGAYTFGGWSILDWPPGFPALLAVPALFGLNSVLAAKIVVVLSVGAAAVLALTLLRRERRPWALYSLCVALLVPTTFLQGTRVMSDWPFAAMAFLFLCLLDRLSRPRLAWAWAAALGALFGAALLTRHVGVCLGAALLVHAWGAARGAERGRRLAALGPPALVAVLGGAMAVGWRLLTLPHVAANEAWASYQSDLGFLDHLSLVAFARQVWDVTMHGARVCEGLAGAGVPWLTGGLAIAATALVAYGGWRQVRANGLRPTDAYVLATAALVATVEWKHARYLLPVAPILVTYLAAGTERAFGWLWARHEALRWWSVRGAIALWLLALIAMDAWLVFRGNDETHRGLSPLVSRSADEFYTGEWHDLERATARIRASADKGAVLVLGRDDLKYPAYFTRRPIARLPDAGAGPQALTAAALCRLRPPYRPGEGLTLFDDEGRALEPLWSAADGRPPDPPGCALSHVLVEGRPPQLDAVAASLGLTAPETFGRLRLYPVPKAQPGP